MPPKGTGRRSTNSRAAMRRRTERFRGEHPMLRRWIALIVVPALLTGCLTGTALDWAHPEVTIRGEVRTVAPEQRITLRVMVKNIEALRDGSYLIRMPEGWPAALAQADGAAAATAKPIELPLEFEDGLSYFPIRGLKALAARGFHSRLPIRDKRAPFPLRADVEKDEDGTC